MLPWQVKSKLSSVQARIINTEPNNWPKQDASTEQQHNSQINGADFHHGHDNLTEIFTVISSVNPTASKNNEWSEQRDADLSGSWGQCTGPAQCCQPRN